MAVSKKKKEKEPTLSGILAIAFVMAILGAFAGFVYLSSFSPRTYSSVQDRKDYEAAAERPAPQPGDAYYFAGSEQRGSGWEVKRNRFFTGAEEPLTLTTGELNAWMSSKFRSPGLTKEEETPKVLIVPGVPNFFIEGEGALYVSLPAEVVIFGNSFKYKIFAKGHFVGEEQPEFVMDRFYVNSAPIPVLAGVAGRFQQTLLKAFSGSEEYAAISAAWARVRSVELSGNELSLRFR